MNKEIKSLTGLRGIAAFYVMIYHYHFLGDNAGFLQGFLDHGYLSVDLFFVLSGFVMALTYSHFFHNGFSLPNYKTFMERRFARIYPLYIFATILAIFHERVFFEPFDPETPELDAVGMMTHAALVQAWGVSKSYMGQTWSISTEMFAYLIFPVLISLTLFKSRVVAIGCFILSFTAILLLYINIFDIPERGIGDIDYSKGSSFTALMRCVAEFTLGLLTYRVFQAKDVAAKFQKQLYLSWLLR